MDKAAWDIVIETNLDPEQTVGSTDQINGQSRRATRNSGQSGTHHCTTSSARNSSNCGIVRPTAFAAFRLITSSNLLRPTNGSANATHTTAIEAAAST